jgi:hypothetical protein
MKLRFGMEAIHAVQELIEMKQSYRGRYSQAGAWE